MDLLITLLALAAVAGFIVFCAWRDHQPRPAGPEPRMISWPLMMVLSSGVALMVIVHLVNLLGVKTGN